MLVAADILSEGSVIDSRYRVNRFLGAGGMGWVVQAADKHLQGAVVAVKLLYPHMVNSAESYQRFRNEVSITRRLSHPAVVQTYGFGRFDGLPYVAMEFVDGATLKDQMQGKYPQGMPLEVLLVTLVQIASALAFAHSRGIIHRDIKPENVLAAASGQVKVADFGLAQMFRDEARLTRAGTIIGTPLYMSPEQIRGETLRRSSDVYSFGILAYELAAGHPPYDGSSFFALAEQHLESSLPELKHDGGRLPQWFTDALKRCTAKNPEERFLSMEEVQLILAGEIKGGLPPAFELRPKETGEPDKQSRYVAMFHRHSRLYSLVLFCFVALSGIITASHFRADVLGPIATAFYYAERITGKELPCLKWIFGVRGKYGDFEWLLATVQRNPAYTKALLRAGMDPNAVHPENREGMVHYIVRANRGEWNRYRLRLLETPSLNLNAPSASGDTPLHIAMGADDAPAAQKLLELGADPNVLNEQGKTPLVIAAEKESLQLLRRLLLNKADPNLCGAERKNTPVGRGPGCALPLHVAASMHTFEAVAALLVRGADANARDEQGRTAAMRFFERMLSELEPEQERILRRLFEETDLSLRDDRGQTVFDYARASRSIAALERVRSGKAFVAPGEAEP